MGAFVRRAKRVQMSAIRSVLAIVAGILLITLIVEPLEFALVALVNGGIVTDPAAYFRVRNQPGFLVAKLVYNTGAAIAGGFVAARLARRSPRAHGLVLAVLQTAAFGWALANPALRQTTPDRMWVALIVVTFAGITIGAELQRKRSIPIDLCP